MAWLTSLLKKPEPVVEPEPEPELAPPPGPAGPELAVLIPDIAGISSFSLNRMPNAAAAAERILSLRTDVRQGIHAFWALHERPIVNDSVHVEALVLIRAAGGSDLVYVVSFLDLESALSFTRFEVRRGLELANVMVYWAAFVKVREEFDGVSLSPSVAPSTRPTFIAPDVEPEPEVSATIAVAEPQPDLVTPVEAEAREAVERYLRQHEEAEDRAAGVVVEDSLAVIEPPPVRTPFVEPQVADPEPEWEPAPEPDWTSASDLEPEPEPIFTPLHEPEAALVETRLDEQPLDIGVPTIFRHPPVESALLAAGLDAGMLADEGPATRSELRTFPADEEIAPEPRTFGAAEIVITGPETTPVETSPGDEEREAFRHFTSQMSHTADSEVAHPDAPKFDDFDIAYEVQRFLQNRRSRTDKRDGPFHGFESPPGRF